MELDAPQSYLGGEDKSHPGLIGKPPMLVGHLSRDEAQLMDEMGGWEPVILTPSHLCLSIKCLLPPGNYDDDS